MYVVVVGAGVAVGSGGRWWWREGCTVVGDGGGCVGAMVCHVQWHCHCVVVRSCVVDRACEKEFENNFKNQLNHGLSNLEMKFENSKVLLLRRFLT